MLMQIVLRPYSIPSPVSKRFWLSYRFNSVCKRVLCIYLSKEGGGGEGERERERIIHMHVWISKIISW